MTGVILGSSDRPTAHAPSISAKARMTFITHRFNSWLGFINRAKFSPEAEKFLPSKTRVRRTRPRNEASAGDAPALLRSLSTFCLSCGEAVRAGVKSAQARHRLQGSLGVHAKRAEGAVALISGVMV